MLKRTLLLTVLTGGAVGAVGAGIVPAGAQPAATPRAYYVAEFELRDPEGIKPYSAGVAGTFEPFGGRFIVRGGEVTSLAGDAPKRVVITGWESLDDVKKWQAGEYGKLIALRDQVAKVRQFAVATCENPQGAKPGQTKCPF